MRIEKLAAFALILAALSMAVAAGLSLYVWHKGDERAAQQAKLIEKF